MQKKEKKRREIRQWLCGRSCHLDFFDPPMLNPPCMLQMGIWRRNHRSFTILFGDNPMYSEDDLNNVKHTTSFDLALSKIFQFHIERKYSFHFLYGCLIALLLENFSVCFFARKRPGKKEIIKENLFEIIKCLFPAAFLYNWCNFNTTVPKSIV